MTIAPGTTNQSVEFVVWDGAGEPVILTAASAGLSIQFQRWSEGGRLLSISAALSITNLASLASAHSDGGLLHVANGRHRLDLPDAAYADGAGRVGLVLSADDIAGFAFAEIELRAERASQASVDAVAEGVAALASNGGVVSTAPARRAGNRVEVEIVRGDTYKDGLANGALDFDEQAWWPADLTDATIKLTARYRRGKHDTTDPAVVLTKAGTVVSPTTPQSVRVELTAAETAAAAVGTHEYDVQATLATGEVVTLAGPGWPFVVRADQTV